MRTVRTITRKRHWPKGAKYYAIDHSGLVCLYWKKPSCQMTQWGTQNSMEYHVLGTVNRLSDFRDSLRRIVSAKRRGGK